MQVETDHDGHRGPDRGAQPVEELAVAVVVLVGGHRAVQVEVDRVGPDGRGRVEDLAGDAFEGVGVHPA